MVTTFEEAASRGDLNAIKRMLREGTAYIDEKGNGGRTALWYAANSERYSTIEWILTAGGASFPETFGDGDNLWSMLLRDNRGYVRNAHLPELTSLLKAMVVLKDAPPKCITLTGFMGCVLSPEHIEIFKEGRRLRARLPAYLDQQRISLLTHCPLPTVLQSLVAAYAEPTREDIWSSRLV
jgi:hypothetical protein